jgi:hypothetical protein
MPRATVLLHIVMVGFLLLAARAGGPVGFAAASLATLTLHAILKRLSDTRLESERRRAELLATQEELDRRRRLATIGQTAATVFHQVGRHHGAIGMYAHLLGRAAADDPSTVRAHAARIQTSVADANRVIDELLRFGRDRELNLYPQALAAVGLEHRKQEGRAGDAEGHHALQLFLVLVVVALLLSWAVGLVLGGVAIGFGPAGLVPFLIAGAILGSGLGGVQVADRVLMVRLSPPDKIGEFFGIYGLVGKGSQVVGQLLYGALIFLLLDTFGNGAYQVAVLSLLVTMLIGLWLIWPVRDDWSGSGEGDIAHHGRPGPPPERLSPGSSPLEPR